MSPENSRPPATSGPRPSGLDRVLAALRSRAARVSGLRWAAGASVLLVSGTLALSVSLAGPSARWAKPQNVLFLGAPLPLDQDAAQTALAQMRSHLGQLFTLQLPEGQTQHLSFGDLGVLLDKSHLAQLVRDSLDPTSPLSRQRRRLGLGPDEPLALPAPLKLDRAKATEFLLGVKAEYDRPARDARLDLAARSVIPSVDGQLLDVDASLERLESAVQAGKTRSELVFISLPAERRTEQLSDVRFDHVIGAFETHYDRSARSAARTHNLRVAASKLDGYVLLAGETFDFNRVVGARDETNGYKVAPVIAQGELVDGIGGGTCQISGTLHGAAFFSGLEIVERVPHTRPSSYIKLGLDATVVYPTINYRFRNPFDFPVVLHQSVKNGVVRAEILGPPAEQTTTLIRRITQAKPFEQVERMEPNLKRGRRLLAQRGVPGFVVRQYRIVRHGRHAVREKWLNRYPPTTQIVLVGTGSDDRGQFRGDGHAEYTADELLVLTQSVGATSATPETFEKREAGRFGVAGWTKEAGMPVFEPTD